MKIGILFLFLGSETSDSIQNWSLTSLDWWKEVYLNSKYIISSPIRWNKGDWGECILILGTTRYIMVKDKTIQDWIQKNRTLTTEKLSSIVEPFGALGAGIGLASLYLTGHVINNESMKKIALKSTESILISGIIVGALKVLVGRSRPYNKEGPYKYSPFNIHDKYQSFPSGHTSTAFSIASCITEEYKNLWVGVPAYLIATMVGISRIHDNKHWASDVLLGAIIGTAVGKTISRIRKN